MNNVRKVCDDLYWVGANDHRTALFENIFPIPRGVSYNSYVLLDEKTAVFDSVDWNYGNEYLHNVEETLAGRPLDYIIVNHMEPDHCASIGLIHQVHPEATIVSTEQAFQMMDQFQFDFGDAKKQVVNEFDTLSLGKHNLLFVYAPMVHWPEVMMTFDTTNGVLFSADAFGTFGALDGVLFNDEVNFERDWLPDARRYLTNIVGKYGPQVQAILAKAGTIDIKMLCPLHGPVWRSNLGWFIDKYDKWSKYEPEEKGVMIAYASMYGHTAYTAQVLASLLHERGVHNVVVYDVSNTHMSQLVSETFRLSHVVLASVTYNLGIYPIMHNYLMDLAALNVQNRTFALIENGTWAAKSGDLMEELLNTQCKTMDIMSDRVTVNSALNEGNRSDMESLADALAEDILGKKSK